MDHLLIQRYIYLPPPTSYLLWRCRRYNEFIVNDWHKFGIEAPTISIKGSPVDLRPDLMEQVGPFTSFTYRLGQLLLWSS